MSDIPDMIPNYLNNNYNYIILNVKVDLNKKKSTRYITVPQTLLFETSVLDTQ